MSRTLHVAQFLGYMGSERSDQGFVHFWSTGDDIRPKPILLAPQRTDAAASLAYHQRSGGRVPGLQAHLPEAVEAPASDISQIQRRGARAANAGAHRCQHAEHGEVIFRVALVLAVRKAGCQQRTLQSALLADTDAVVLQVRAIAARRGEHFLAHRIVDATDLD